MVGHAMATPSDRWELGRDALAALVERLGTGGAGEYETLRRKLIGFFDLRGAGSPEVAADETFDRVARKLQDGTPVQNLRAYVFGVARRVLLEGERRERRDRVAQETWVLLHGEPGPDAATEERFACLERCLAALPAEARALIEAYHGKGGGTAPADRAALAARLGLSDAALRTRAHRIRNELAACLGRFLARGGR